MSGPRARTPLSYFRAMWSANDDPWAHSTRWYEARKYDLTVTALSRPHYRRGFEPACGTGLLTERLLSRCDHLVASDLHPRAVELTRRRCGHDRLDVSVGAVPGDWPSGTFDLIVLSEVLYYLDPEEVEAVVARCLESAAPGGEIMAVHYRPRPDEHRLSGDEVHEIIAAGPGLRQLASHVEEDFRLDAWRLP